MADNVSVNNDGGTPDPYIVSTEELADASHVENLQLVTVSGTAKTDLARAEDTAAASGHMGIAILVVRQDVAAALAGTDGDYTFLGVDALNQLRIAPLAAGTNNIGAIDVLTEPALDFSTDQVGAAAVTNVVMNDRTELTPKFKSLDVAASQTNATVIAAVASKKLRVLSLFAQCGGTGTSVLLESDEATDVRLHYWLPGEAGGHVLPFSPVGWFETAAGSALLATTGGGSSTAMTLAYVEV